MVFNSIEFLIFLPIVTFLYFVIPHKYRWIFLLIASYYFYIAWDYKLIWLILCTTLISYGTALILKKTKKPALKKIELAVALICCLGILVFFKYFDFISLSITNFLNFVHIPAEKFTLQLILPVGISFYTFQALSYVIDVYYGRIEPEKHFGYYALYVSYFPQLVAGPIERPDNLIPQLKSERKFTFDNFRKGIRIIISGFVKKVVVADTLAIYVNSVYNNVAEANGLSVLIATLLFAVQIYCDFSGYTDIAVGCARVMGVNLSKNFDYPYVAKSIKDFWSRWHISLSSWLKDYIYIPLGGNRCSKARNMYNIFIVFLISGIWHGAAWTFVLWGVLHAVYQIVGSLTIKYRNKFWETMGLKSDSVIIGLLRQAITFLMVDFAWILFRANSISDFGVLAKKLFTDWNVNKTYIGVAMNSLSIDGQQLLICAMCICIMILCDIMYTNGEKCNLIAQSDVSSVSVCTQKNTLFLLWLIAIAWLLLLSQNGASSFIYFQF